MSRRDRILQWLHENPGWRYGLEIARGAKVWRIFIYTELSDLEDEQLISSRIDPECEFGRHQYRLKHHGRREEAVTDLGFVIGRVSPPTVVSSGRTGIPDGPLSSTMFPAI